MDNSKPTVRPREPRNRERYRRLLSDGLSVQQIANRCSVSIKTLWSYVTRHGIHSPNRATLPEIWFNGFRYTLRKTGYYARSTNPRNQLHRDMWELKNGPIPHGHDIHHKDFNPANNVDSNFQCITKSEHGRITMQRRWGRA